MNVLPCSFAVVTAALIVSPGILVIALAAGIGAFLGAATAVGRWLATRNSVATATLPMPSPQVIAPVSLSAPTASATASTLAAAVAPVLSPAPIVPAGITNAEVLVIIAAAVRATFGAGARIAKIASVSPTVPSVEPLMQHWSMEGRRQIYSSHQIR